MNTSKTLQKSRQIISIALTLYTDAVTGTCLNYISQFLQEPGKYVIMLYIDSHEVDLNVGKDFGLPTRLDIQKHKRCSLRGKEIFKTILEYFESF